MARPSSLARREPTQGTLFEGRLGASIEETATALGVQRDTIYRLIGDGRLTISNSGAADDCACHLHPTAAGRDRDHTQGPGAPLPHWRLGREPQQPCRAVRGGAAR